MWTLPPGTPTSNRQKPDRLRMPPIAQHAKAASTRAALPEAGPGPILTREERQLAEQLGLLRPGTPPGYVQALANLMREPGLAPLRRGHAIRLLADAAQDGLPVGQTSLAATRAPMRL
jgi:hypothetical protein